MHCHLEREGETQKEDWGGDYFVFLIANLVVQLIAY